MYKQICRSTLFGTFALHVACGSPTSSTPTAAGAPPESAPPVLSPAVGSCTQPPDDPDCFLDVNDHPFIGMLVGSTDGSSTARLGRSGVDFCISGVLDEGPAGSGWGSSLVLSFGEQDDVAPFDASALGITRIELNLDGPPPTGVEVGVITSLSAECTELGPVCHAPYTRFDELNRVIFETTSTTVDLKLSELAPPPWARDTPPKLDPSLLRGITFTAAPPRGAPLDYEYCIRDLRFFDASGGAVTSRN
jgi:hypothetical protein